MVASGGATGAWGQFPPNIFLPPVSPHDKRCVEIRQNLIDFSIKMAKISFFAFFVCIFSLFCPLKILMLVPPLTIPWSISRQKAVTAALLPNSELSDFVRIVLHSFKACNTLAGKSMSCMFACTYSGISHSLWYTWLFCFTPSVQGAAC